MSADALEIVPGVFVLGDFPRVHPDEALKDRFKLLRQGQFGVDPFEDEIMLVVETPKCSRAMLGCSHPGMRNMLDAVISRFKASLAARIWLKHRRKA